MLYLYMYFYICFNYILFNYFPDLPDPGFQDTVADFFEAKHPKGANNYSLKVLVGANN